MKTIIINNAGPRGPVGPQGETGPSGSDANVPPLIISSSKQFTDITSPFTGSFTGSFKGDISVSTTTITAATGSFSHIKGNSPITVQDSITFQQPVTGSIFSGSFVGDGSGLTDVLPTGVLSGSAQIATEISGAFGASSASFSTRISANEVITAKTLISGSVQIASNISGSFTAPSSSFSTRVTANETNISSNTSLITGITAKTLISGSAQIATEISGAFALTSASFSNRTTTLENKTVYSGSFSGSFQGNGSSLTNIPASGIVGLNLSQIASGSATASISPDKGLIINTDTKITGATQITGSLTVSGSVEFPGRRGITSNVVVGLGSGASLGSGATDNIILGKDAGSALSIGDRNILIGTDAGKALTQAGENVIIGRRAGQVLHSTNAMFNVVIGADAGQGAGGSGHARNVIIGHTAGYETDGQQNVYIGNQAAKGVGGADADYGVAVGSYALYSIRDGHKNATLGAGSLFTVRDGSDNIGLGYYAGYNIQDGSGNIIIGSGSLGEAAMSNQLRIGHADNIIISGSLSNGGIKLLGQVSASSYIGDGSGLTGIETDPFPYTGSVDISGSLSVKGTSRTIYTSASIVYSNNLPTQVTQSFGNQKQQITNIIYSGTTPTSVEVTGSDSVNKKYAFTYTNGNITEIRVT